MICCGLSCKYLQSLAFYQCRMQYTIHFIFWYNLTWEDIKIKCCTNMSLPHASQTLLYHYRCVLQEKSISCYTCKICTIWVWNSTGMRKQTIFFNLQKSLESGYEDIVSKVLQGWVIARVVQYLHWLSASCVRCVRIDAAQRPDEVINICKKHSHVTLGLSGGVQPGDTGSLDMRHGPFSFLLLRWLFWRTAGISAVPFDKILSW